MVLSHSDLREGTKLHYCVTEEEDRGETSGSLSIAQNWQLQTEMLRLN